MNNSLDADNIYKNLTIDYGFPVHFKSILSDEIKIKTNRMKSLEPKEWNKNQPSSKRYTKNFYIYLNNNVHFPYVNFTY